MIGAYEDAIATPKPVGFAQQAAVAIGTEPADLKPRVKAKRLPSLEPPVLRPRHGPIAAAAPAGQPWLPSRSEGSRSPSWR